MGEFLEYLRTTQHKPKPVKLSETMNSDFMSQLEEQGEESDLSEDGKLE